MTHKRTKEEFEEAARKSRSIAAMCRNLGLKFKPFIKTPIGEILVPNSTFQTYKLKKRLLEDGIKQHVCEHCGLTHWQGMVIPLELHHINGDNRDNRLENLQILCPNCHALTDSYRGKNKKSPKKLDDMLLLMSALKENEK